MNVTSAGTWLTTESSSTDQWTTNVAPTVEEPKIHARAGWVSDVTVREIILAQHYKQINEENKQFANPAKQNISMTNT